MSRVVRIGTRTIELSGLQQVWLGVDHLSNSRITLYYPNGPTKTIDYAYGQWADAERDKKSIEDALRPRNDVEPRKPPFCNLTSREGLL